MRRTFTIPAGTITRLHVDCPRLAANMLEDPTRRIVDLWIPAGSEAAGLPLLVDLVGFMSGGPVHTNWRAFGENVPERLDRLVHEGRMKPCVVAFPDCFTRLGGNQYVNSLAMGPWMDAICDDIVPQIEARFGCGGRGRRAVFGKSSGGYGALVHAMLRPDTWSAAACHSGDMGFDLCYLPEMAATLRGLARYGGTPLSFVQSVEAQRWRGKGDGKDGHVLMMLAMAASYDPDPGSPLGIRLPVTADTCEIIPDRWSAWMAWDPIELAPRCVDSLRKLKCLIIDCGDRDQYNLVYGARRLTRLLTAAGVSHRYEEFPDDHSGVDYRMDDSLPALVDALQ